MKDFTEVFALFLLILCAIRLPCGEHSHILMPQDVTAVLPVENKFL